MNRFNFDYSVNASLKYLKKKLTTIETCVFTHGFSPTTPGAFMSIVFIFLYVILFFKGLYKLIFLLFILSFFLGLIFDSINEKFQSYCCLLFILALISLVLGYSQLLELFILFIVSRAIVYTYRRVTGNVLLFSLTKIDSLLIVYFIYFIFFVLTGDLTNFPTSMVNSSLCMQESN